MLTMQQIYKGLEEQFICAKAQEDELGKKYDDVLKRYAEVEAEFKDIQAKFTKVKNNRTSIEMSMEALSELGGDFTLTEEEKEELVKTEALAGIPVEIPEEKEPEKKQLVWKHKTAYIVQYSPDGKVLGKYRTQKEAANKLNCSPATVSYQLKISQKQQVKKKGYYLKYEY